MKHLTVALVTVACLAQGPVLAQEKELSGVDAEQSLIATAIRKLNAYASKCERAGARTKARIAWLEIVHEYHVDHGETREKLGHKKVGTVWSPPPATEDLLPEPDDVSKRVVRKLENTWTALGREMGAAHAEVARRFQKEGNTDRVNYHYRRALRFDPTISEAGLALGLKSYQGAWVTPIQLQVLLRERLLGHLVDVLNKTTYEVVMPEGKQNKWLERVREGMSDSFRCFKGPTAELWGDLPPKILRTAVHDIERCNLLIRGLFCGYSKFRWELDDAPLFIVTKEEMRYRALVDSTDETAKEKAFSKDHVSGVWLGSRADNAYGTWKVDLDNLRDSVIRNTANHFAHTNASALDEGFGHASCAWLRGKSLSFFLNLEEAKKPKPQGHTVSGTPEKKVDNRLLIPEIAYWRDLVLQQAWEGTGPSLGQLMLFTVQHMPHAARIKAWSMVHYLTMRDPRLIRYLDKAAEKAGDPDTVRKRFDAISPIPLDRLEADWRNYWRSDESRLAPWRDEPAKDLGERKVEKWLQQVSLWRCKHRLAPLGHAPGLPENVETLVQKRTVLEALEGDRDPDGEEVDKLQTEMHWKQLLIVPKRLLEREVTEELFLVPGYRDLLCAPVVGMIRYAVHTQGVILYVSPVDPGETACPPAFYPPSQEKTVPGRFPVAALGSRAVKLYKMEWDVAGAKEIGYPFTLHLGPVDADYDPNVSCKVDVDGKGLGVTLIEPRENLPRRLSIPGVYVCFPRKPLTKGKQVVVTWKWYPRDGGPQTKQLEFTSR